MVTSKLADLLLSPKTTLTTIMTVIGAPAWMIQLLVPIREAGALLPQILYAKGFKHTKKRHHFWRMSMTLQFLSSALILFSLHIDDPRLAGGLLLVALLVFSLARAMSSLTMKDIQGVHVEKGSRGKLLGSAGSISSVFGVCIALLAIFDQVFNDTNHVLFIGAIALFCQFIAIIVLWSVRTEVESSTRLSKAEFSRYLWLFIGVRSLLAHSALLAPVFVIAYDGNLLNMLAYLILAQSLASLVSSYIWGRVSDKSALRSMQAGACICLLANALLLVIILVFEHHLSSTLLMISLYFLLSIGHNGIRTGRKIYAVDVAKGENRTAFVAISNSVVGGFLLCVGVVYGLLAEQALVYTLSAMTVFLFAGLCLSFILSKEK